MNEQAVSRRHSHQNISPGAASEPTVIDPALLPNSHKVLRALVTGGTSTEGDTWKHTSHACLGEHGNSCQW